MNKSLNAEDYLVKITKAYPGLVHATNMLTKLQKKDEKKANKAKGLVDDIIEKYKTYLDEQLNLDGFKDKVVEERVRLLNDYYDFLDSYNESKKGALWKEFNAQSKFRSSILEEFLVLLFKSIQKEHKDLEIKLGGAKSYSNLYFYGENFEQFMQKPSIKVNVKDQDFAIYREVTINIDEEEESQEKICIPVVALECKTYIDKTMFEGAVATADKIKIGNPCTMFAVVTEEYDIEQSVNPAYSRIDQIYVLRKSSRSKNKKSKNTIPVYSDVVKKLVNDVREHINRPWVDIKRKLKNDGILI
jgi:hypothetical protein